MTKEQKRQLEDARFECERRELVARTMKAQVEWYKATIEVRRLELELARIENEQKEFIESLPKETEQQEEIETLPSMDARIEKKNPPSPVSSAQYTEEDLCKAEETYREWGTKMEKLTRHIYAAGQEYQEARRQTKSIKDKTLKALSAGKAKEVLANLLKMQKEYDAMKLARRVEWDKIGKIRRELGLPQISQIG